jgi:phage shock protein A
VAESTLGRIGQLLRTNLDALLDAAEDPEKLLAQLVRDYTDGVRTAELAVVPAVGELRLLEDDLRGAEAAAREWRDGAAAASGQADRLRASGRTGDADRFDELARAALRREIGQQAQATALARRVAQQRELTDALHLGLEQLRRRREGLIQKRGELVSRAKIARAQVQLRRAADYAAILDPTSELGRLEARVRREEATARGMEALRRDPLADRFVRLEAEDDEREVESRLAALKASRAGHPAAGRTRSP